MLQVTEFLDIFTSYWAEEQAPGEADNPNNRLIKKPLRCTGITSFVVLAFVSHVRLDYCNAKEHHQDPFTRKAMTGSRHIHILAAFLGHLSAGEFGVQASPGDGNPT